ncbi:unnamed protein product [Durusdinium trenchii]
MKADGHTVASFDVLYGDPKPMKQDVMNLLTPSGFALAALAILNCKMDGFVSFLGLLCSSYVTVNAGTHGRTPFHPLGNSHYPSVQLSNALTSRTCLLIYLITAMGGVWILEQPRSSLVSWHPRIRLLWKSIPKVWQAAWWAAHY